MFKKKFTLLFILIIILLFSKSKIYINAQSSLLVNPDYTVYVNNEKADIKPAIVNNDIFFALDDLSKYTSLNIKFEKASDKTYIHISVPSFIQIKKIGKLDYVDFTHYNKIYNSSVNMEQTSGEYSSEILPYTVNLGSTYGMIITPDKKRIGFATKLINGQNYIQLDTFKEKIYPIIVDMIIKNQDAIDNQHASYIFNYPDERHMISEQNKYQIILNSQYINLQPLDVYGRLYISLNDLSEYTPIYANINSSNNNINLIDSSRLMILDYDNSKYVDISDYKLKHILYLYKNSDSAKAGSKNKSNSNNDYDYNRTIENYNIKEVGYHNLVELGIFEKQIYPKFLNIITLSEEQSKVKNNK